MVKYPYMSHPHASFLAEFQIAINKMKHYAMPDLVEAAQKKHDELLANETVTEHEIHKALSDFGRREYPFRKAYHDLCAGDEEQRLQSLVLERLDEGVKNKVLEHTKHGVLIDDYVKSKLFEEELTPEERLQIENAILLAEEVLNSQCDERTAKRKEQYVDLVKKWEDERDRLQKMIDQLRAMGKGSVKWQSEIDSITDKLEEGWSIVERDPQEEEIKKEIEYWDTVLHEVEDETVA